MPNLIFVLKEDLCTNIQVWKSTEWVLACQGLLLCSDEWTETGHGLWEGSIFRKHFHYLLIFLAGRQCLRGEIKYTVHHMRDIQLYHGDTKRKGSFWNWALSRISILTPFHLHWPSRPYRFAKGSSQPRLQNTCAGSSRQELRMAFMGFHKQISLERIWLRQVQARSIQLLLSLSILGIPYATYLLSLFQIIKTKSLPIQEPVCSLFVLELRHLFCVGSQWLWLSSAVWHSGSANALHIAYLWVF